MNIVTAQELADLLGLKPEAVNRYGREGIFPRYKVGRQTRYDLDEVLKVTRERCDHQTPESRIRGIDGGTGN